MSQPIPITQSNQRHPDKATSTGSSGQLESEPLSNRNRSISHSSQSSSTWLESTHQRNSWALRNSSESSKRRSLIINPLWFEQEAKPPLKESGSSQSLPAIDWKAKFPGFNATSLARPVDDIHIVSSAAPIEEACKKLLELASDPASTDFLVVCEDGNQSRWKGIFDHSVLNRFLSLVLSPASARSPTPHSLPLTPASDPSHQSPLATGWSFPIQQASGSKAQESSSTFQAILAPHSIEETEKEILRLAKEEKAIPVSMVLDLAADKVDTRIVSAETDLGEIILLLSNQSRRIMLENDSPGANQREPIGVLTQGSVLEFLLSKSSQESDLSSIFERSLEELNFLQERVLEISAESTLLEAMQLLSLEKYTALAVFDNRGSMISSINVNEVSLSILRSSSKNLLSTSLSNFINRNLASREEGTEGKEAMPILRLGTNANLGRALASLLATKSAALYVFENEDDLAQGLTPPLSATSSDSSFKECGFLQDLSHALPSLSNLGGSAASLGRGSGHHWTRTHSHSGHSPSSSLGSATSTSRSGSQSHSIPQAQSQSQSQTQTRGAVSISGNPDIQRIPLARRSSSASHHGGTGGHRRQHTPSNPSSGLPPASPSRLSLALGSSPNNPTLKGLITLQEILQIFSKVSQSIPKESTADTA